MNEQLIKLLAQVTVTKERGVPLYLQIREALQDFIAQGAIEIGDQLPSEDDLASQFGVSRMTVRHALDELVGNGTLKRVHGRGTIVASRRMVRNYNRLVSFYEDAQRLNLNPSSRILAREEMPATAQIAEALAIDVAAPVIHLTRLRYTKRDLIAINEVYASQELCPWLLSEDLENQSLYFLYDQHGLTLEWGRQYIEARAASPEQARILRIKVGSPVLYLERTTYTVNDRPVEWTQAFTPSDSYSIEMILRR